MLINATQNEEIRVAIVKDNILQDLDIEFASPRKTKSNIYKAKVTRVEPSLGAAFIEYGSKKQGFLPLKEVAKRYYPAAAKELEKPTIADILSPGQEIMVQVEKIERGNKGAALTTYISIAGCYMVLMPYNPETGGISRRIEGEEREEMKALLENLELPKDTGAILRTAGLGKSVELLQWDLEIITNQWNAIENAYQQKKAPFLIYQDSDVIIRSIRDNLRKEVSEIIIDDSNVFSRARQYIEQIRPDFLEKLKLYQDTIPLFTRFNIEHQIESAHQREITLPSGGSIVIDKTEALYAVDINSAKATKGADLEETAYNTNMEASAEIARQIKIRDIGGLVVIDFIDMSQSKHQKEVENHFKDSIKNDKARIQIGKISKFGLLEFSRQRIRPALTEFSNIVCPRCDGFGTVRNTASLALSMLRIIEENALNDSVKQINIQLPVSIATYLLNEKRNLINQIEIKFEVNVVIIPNQYLDTPDYRLELINSDHNENAKLSYKLVEKPDNNLNIYSEDMTAQEPAVKNVKLPNKASKPNAIVQWIKNLFAFKSKQRSFKGKKIYKRRYKKSNFNKTK